MQIYFYILGNLDGFHLGTWMDFTWELGWISLGNLDGFCLGTWLIFYSSSIYIYKKKETQHVASLQMINNHYFST